MSVYPYKFEPIYKQKIWGGRNLERLFGRALPPGEKIGESWELADLTEGTSIISNGPEAGKTLTELMRRGPEAVLGRASPTPDGRFPLLGKLLDANDILSLQVHPDAVAAKRIGPAAAAKTECWYIIESRGGYIYKGLKDDVTPKRFREAVEDNAVEELLRRFDVTAGEFHYLPAGTVHATGPGVVLAEVQTPSDTTYRLTDWGRGRPIQLERSLQCIHFDAAEEHPGFEGARPLVTEFFTLARRTAAKGSIVALPEARCAVLMFLEGGEALEIHHEGPEAVTTILPGDTVLLSAGLRNAMLKASGSCAWLEVTLPDR